MSKSCGAETALFMVGRDGTPKDPLELDKHSAHILQVRGERRGQPDLILRCKLIVMFK